MARPENLIAASFASLDIVIGGSILTSRIGGNNGLWASEDEP